MTVFWPALVIGILAWCMAPLLWRHRDRISLVLLETRRRVYGERFAEWTRTPTGWSAGVTAVGAAVIGTALVVSSLLGLDW